MFVPPVLLVLPSETFHHFHGLLRDLNFIPAKVFCYMLQNPKLCDFVWKITFNSQHYLAQIIPTEHIL